MPKSKKKKPNTAKCSAKFNLAALMYKRNAFWMNNKARSGRKNGGLSFARCKRKRSETYRPDLPNCVDSRDDPQETSEQTRVTKLMVSSEDSQGETNQESEQMRDGELLQDTEAKDGTRTGPSRKKSKSSRRSVNENEIQGRVDCDDPETREARGNDKQPKGDLVKTKVSREQVNDQQNENCSGPRDLDSARNLSDTDYGDNHRIGQDLEGKVADLDSEGAEGCLTEADESNLITGRSGLDKECSRNASQGDDRPLFQRDENANQDGAGSGTEEDASSEQQSQNAGSVEAQEINEPQDQSRDLEDIEEQMRTILKRRGGTAAERALWGSVQMMRNCENGPKLWKALAESRTTIAENAEAEVAKQLVDQVKKSLGSSAAKAASKIKELMVAILCSLDSKRAGHHGNTAFRSSVGGKDHLSEGISLREIACMELEDTRIRLARSRREHGRGSPVDPDMFCSVLRHRHLDVRKGLQFTLQTIWTEAYPGSSLCALEIEKSSPCRDKAWKRAREAVRKLFNYPVLSLKEKVDTVDDAVDPNNHDSNNEASAEGNISHANDGHEHMPGSSQVQDSSIVDESGENGESSETRGSERVDAETEDMSVSNYLAQLKSLKLPLRSDSMSSDDILSAIHDCSVRFSHLCSKLNLEEDSWTCKCFAIHVIGWRDVQNNSSVQDGQGRNFPQENQKGNISNESWSDAEFIFLRIMDHIGVRPPTNDEAEDVMYLRDFSVTAIDVKLCQTWASKHGIGSQNIWEISAQVLCPERFAWLYMHCGQGLLAGNPAKVGASNRDPFRPTSRGQTRAFINGARAGQTTVSSDSAGGARSSKFAPLDQHGIMICQPLCLSPKDAEFTRTYFETAERAMEQVVLSSLGEQRRSDSGKLCNETFNAIDTKGNLVLGTVCQIMTRVCDRALPQLCAMAKNLYDHPVENPAAAAKRLRAEDPGDVAARCPFHSQSNFQDRVEGEDDAAASVDYNAEETGNRKRAVLNGKTTLNALEEKEKGVREYLVQVCGGRRHLDSCLLSSFIRDHRSLAEGFLGQDVVSSIFESGQMSSIPECRTCQRPHYIKTPIHEWMTSDKDYIEEQAQEEIIDSRNWVYDDRFNDECQSLYDYYTSGDGRLAQRLPRGNGLTSKHKVDVFKQKNGNASQSSRVGPSQTRNGERSNNAANTSGQRKAMSNLTPDISRSERSAASNGGKESNDSDHMSDSSFSLSEVDAEDGSAEHDSSPQRPDVNVHLDFPDAPPLTATVLTGTSARSSDRSKRTASEAPGRPRREPMPDTCRERYTKEARANALSRYGEKQDSRSRAQAQPLDANRQSIRSRLAERVASSQDSE